MPPDGSAYNVRGVLKAYADECAGSDGNMTWSICLHQDSNFVASTAALIATGWSEPVPGRVYPAVDHRLFTAHPVLRLTIQVTVPVGKMIESSAGEAYDARTRVAIGELRFNGKQESHRGWASNDFEGINQHRRSCRRPGVFPGSWVRCCPKRMVDVGLRSGAHGLEPVRDGAHEGQCLPTRTEMESSAPYRAQ